ncbi:MAG TPA: hypothetical protein VGA00_05345 [Acidiferrobacterales bacterium]|jgi:hypothetical protein
MLIALALIVGQPAFAAAPSAPMSMAPAAHAAHYDLGAGDPRLVNDDDRQNCPQHETCDGKCCVACGHCVVGAVPTLPAGNLPARSVESPVIPALHSAEVPDPHPRPPQLPAV